MVPKRQYWFTVGARSKDRDLLDDALTELKKEFRIDHRAFGSGYHDRVEADFFVRSSSKRRKIKKYISKYISSRLRFRTYP